jgi:hypothetical protein
MRMDVVPVTGVTQSSINMQVKMLVVYSVKKRIRILNLSLLCDLVYIFIS